jgi:ADP-heptose:LPS heptosyltransferase
MTTAALEELIHAISTVRRRLAPPKSYREKLLRAIYVPLVKRLSRGTLTRVEPNPVCQTLPGQAVIGAALAQVPRILILKLDHIGDFIVSMAAMQHLRDHFSTAHITLVCGSWSRDWATRIGLFDEIVVFDGLKRTGTAWKGITPQLIAQYQSLALPTFDLAIDLRHDPDTRILLTKTHARIRAGYCAPLEAGGGCLDISLPDVEHVTLESGSGRPLPAEQRLLLLASAVTNSFAKPPHPARCLISAPTAHAPHGPFAVLAPGASGAIRIWNVDRLRAVGTFLMEQYDLDLVVIGAEPERRVAEAFVKSFSSGRVHNAVGLSLVDLPNLIQGARLYVGYDTGPTHLAAALGVPTVSVLTGSTNADVWRTLGEKVVVVRGKTDCSPCHLTEVSQCPHGVVCLDVVQIEDVVSACQQLLGPAESRTNGRGVALQLGTQHAVA